MKIVDTVHISEAYKRSNLYREGRILSQLHHPNIIRFYEVLRAQNLYCLVMEQAEGGSLMQYVQRQRPRKRLEEHLTRNFMRQLLSALHYMHEIHVVHR